MSLFAIVAFVIAVRMLFINRILSKIYRFEDHKNTKWGGR